MLNLDRELETTDGRRVTFIGLDPRDDSRAFVLWDGTPALINAEGRFLLLTDPNQESFTDDFRVFNSPSRSYAPLYVGADGIGIGPLETEIKAVESFVNAQCRGILQLSDRGGEVEAKVLPVPDHWEKPDDSIPFDARG